MSNQSKWWFGPVAGLVIPIWLTVTALSRIVLYAWFLVGPFVIAALLIRGGFILWEWLTQ